MHTTHESANHANLSSYRKGKFFNALPAEALADFERLLAPSSYSSGMIIFSETQSGSGIYVVLDGEVKLSINSAEGRRLSFRIARAGEVLGLSSAISGGAYEMTADALYPSKVAHIERPAFLGFLSRHPTVYQVVAREMVRTYSAACEQLRTVGLSTSVPKRLARLLLGWSDETETDRKPERQAYCRLSLTHEQIGEFIGASRETVTRALSSFKNRHLIAQHGSIVTIPDRVALESYVHA